MKNLLTLLSVIALGSFNLSAQEERQIWTAALDYLYYKEAIITIHPNQKYPIDPVNPEFDTTDSYIDTFPVMIHIYSKILDYNAVDIIEVRFKRLLENNKLRTGEFQIISRADSLQINEKKLSFCHRFMGYTQSKDFNEKEDTCLKYGVPRKIPIESVFFSKISLTHNMNYALVYAYIHIEKNRGNDLILGFLLKRKKDAWKVIDFGSEFAR